MKVKYLKDLLKDVPDDYNVFVALNGEQGDYARSVELLEDIKTLDIKCF